MSITRISADGSDVYLYEHVDGFIHCCFCELPESNEGGPYFNNGNGARLDTACQALLHCRAHRAAGHTVPEYALEYFEKNCVTREPQR